MPLVSHAYSSVCSLYWPTLFFLLFRTGLGVRVHLSVWVWLSPENEIVKKHWCSQVSRAGWTLADILICCVTLGKQLNLSEL